MSITTTTPIKWAERRRIESHPKTGAAQLVEVRERIVEVPISKPVEVSEPRLSSPLLFVDTPDEELMGYGVPAEWLDDVRTATEESLLDLIGHVPQKAGEALLNLATGTAPPEPEVALPAADPFAYPDAQRRFRVVANVEELERALEFPWEKWTVFLHPVQRALVERKYNGPARISGSAGTGKTVVALHRAVHLVRRNPRARILLTTFSHALSNALKTKLSRLVGNEPGVHGRITVHSIPGLAYRGVGVDLAKVAVRLTSDPASLCDQKASLAIAVSEHIGAMPFLRLAVEDLPRPESLHGLSECDAIALLRNYDLDSLDPPTPGWLGPYSDRDRVVRSGL